jgi:hypothetical protein
MPITRRPTANGTASAQDINAVIGRGGSVPRSTANGKSHGPIGRGPFVAVMLRIPKNNLKRVDRLVGNRAVNISRNMWIMEAIHEKILRESTSSTPISL